MKRLIPSTNEVIFMLSMKLSIKDQDTTAQVALIDGQQNSLMNILKIRP